MLIILYTVTIFLGSLLLFWVQPMAGKMLLPLLGGAPAVWNTAMVFYQATLLAGYAYAHFSTKWLGVRRQTLVHFALLWLPLLALPIVIPHGWTPPTIQNPIPWLLTVLAVMVGLPFFVVSTTSPLLQRWFSYSGHRYAGDPYFLYAAGNCGSLLALISYPVLVEPHLGLSQQSRWWSVGYVVLLALTAICGIWTWCLARNPVLAAGPAPRTVDEKLTVPRRLRWILLAFVPCSLMLSVTTYITSEIMPLPLLWVIPLGIYLLTFILVFARRQLIPHRWMVWAMPVAVVTLVIMLARMDLKAQAFGMLAWPMAVHLIGLFIVAMFCHGELAEDRPTVAHLTEFFLWISVGGVLGGMFNALLAPVIFPTVIEYPVTLLLACTLMPKFGWRTTNRRTRILDVALPVLLGLFTAALIYILEHAGINSPKFLLVLECVPPAVLCLLFLRRPLRFVLGVFFILVSTSVALRPEFHNALVARSFFGIYRVELYPGAPHIHMLRHGTTWHAMQSLKPNERRIPLLFYTKRGPAGETIASLPPDLTQHVGLIGLGAGTMASYAKPGEHWTFYEIDPEIQRIACDPRYFTYMQDCLGDVKIVLGDARLSLHNAPDHQFGLLVVDAYNSDAIPLHLLTREALALYLQKLTPSGVILINVSNRHLDIEPVLANLAQDAGLLGRIRYDPVTFEEFQGGKAASWWVVLTRNAPWLNSLSQDKNWLPLQKKPGVGLWTDDFTSVFSVFHWD
jgi:hypothetical protein